MLLLRDIAKRVNKEKNKVKGMLKKRKEYISSKNEKLCRTGECDFLSLRFLFFRIRKQYRSDNQIILDKIQYAN